MKKFLKFLGLTFGILVILGFIGFIVLLKTLPSPREIGKYLQPKTAKTALQEVQKSAPNADGTESKNPQPSAATTSQDASAKTDANEKEERLMLGDLTDPQKPLSEVCAHLDQASLIHLQGYTLDDFGKGFKDSVMTEKKDPVVQALKPSIRFMFKQPQMKEMLNAAMDAADKGEVEESLMQKAGFYAKAYAAYNELRANKKTLEQVMDRSYNLMILSKVLAKRPDLINDSAVNNFCKDIETALNNANPMDSTEERKAFNDFFEDTGLKPEEVDYDPNYKTELDVKLTKTQLKIEGGWMSSIIQPTKEELKALGEEANKPE